MKHTKFAKKLAAALACTSMLAAVIPAASISAHAAEYKVYKNDITVEWLGATWTHDEFSQAWTDIYEAFGADITIRMVKNYTQSPHSEEWIRVGGPQHFADCWFQQHWYDANDMRDAYYRYTIGEGWNKSEGWR